VTLYDLEVDGRRLGFRFTSATHAVCFAVECGLWSARWVTAGRSDDTPDTPAT